jgi:DNA-binding CsgD family transcriptional regulator
MARLLLRHDDGAATGLLGVPRCPALYWGTGYGGKRMTDLGGDFPWMKIHALLLETGSIRAPKEFGLHLIGTVNQLIPYDQARVYFINGNAEICDVGLYGAKRSWFDAYMDYYSKIDDGRYALCRNGLRHETGVHSVSFDWSAARYDEFIADYIKPQGIRHSLTSFFHDDDGLVKAVCTFERVSAKSYTPKEIAILEIMQAHLDNLHKNLYVQLQSGPRSLKAARPARFPAPLTQRESEIMALICGGVTSENMAKNLCISKTTVYRHIANIYAKLHVSNRQELILTALQDAAAGGVKSPA